MRSEADRTFGEFVALRGDTLLRTATLLCAGDRAAGEDLLQGALERVLRHWRRGIPDAPEAYVRRAMVNAAVRGRTRRFQEVPTDAVPERQVASGTGTVDDSDLLRRALVDLPPRQRAAVVLRFYEDLTEAETAALLGCSVGTVKSSVSRGLARLRDNANVTIDLTIGS